MKRVLWLVGIGWIGAAAWAQPAKQPVGRWATALGRDTLARATLGVLGKAIRVEPLAGHGVSVVVIRIEETLWGTLPPGTQELSTVRSEEGAKAEQGKRVVAFVRQMRTSWQAVGLFFLSKKEGASRLALLRRHLALEKQPPGAARDRAHRVLITEGLASASDDWEFSLYCGELYKRMADTRGLLEPDFRREVSRLAFSLAQAARADELRGLLRLLPPARAGRRRTSPKEVAPLVDAKGEPLVAQAALDQLAQTKDGPTRIKRLRALAGWRTPGVRTALIQVLTQETAPLAEREAATFALGAHRDRAATPALRRMVEDGEQPTLVRLAIRALGMNRARSAVGAIGRRLGLALGRPAERALADEGLIALGRIGGQSARQTLTRVAARAGDPGQRRLALYCLSQAPRR